MLDVKDLRNDLEKIKTALAKRGKDFGFEEFLALDKKRRAALSNIEEKKAAQNAASKKIPKLPPEEKETLLAEMKKISDEIKNLEPEIKSFDDQIESFLLNIPNAPHESVPAGADDSFNLEIRKCMEPRGFDFEPKAHWDLGESLGILDPAAAAKITGARFTVYRGAGAKLERALINFMLDTHTERGYTEIFPPFMVHRNSMIGTGQLPKFEEDAFKVAGTEYFLVPTAEVPVTNLFREEIIDGARLPIKYTAYTACFRAEAGSAGRDTRGLIRQHQFNKVELVKFAAPENSYDELEKLTEDAEYILRLLKLPYRVAALCGGDLGFASAKTYDIEVWLPSYGRYAEISSCSNYETFQARRANIRFKNSPKDKAQYVHTLNGSGLAIGRTTAAILENYQNPDGSITIPEVLIPYMGTDKII
jgi:seryl-tRNA synthetase